ncbi:ATP phosphoribosyltransferase regulatory subunit, partial [Candidatus Micrarchaeota archaeon]|nr:ATP phosphoribosyltransferase regulatory subunit [Candidatus Micrarchaeota archaeon]
MENEKLTEELLSPPRGTRDFLPEEKLLRDALERKLEQAFQRFGFNPIETPAFERFEVLSSKYAGGSEILKETYSFEDQGKRKLGLRYDLTVPMCRVVASNPSLA